MRMRIICALVALSLTASCFTGCGFLDGRTATAKEALAKRMEQESDGLIELVNLQKTDGRETDADGAKWYVLLFSGTLRYTGDCYKANGLGGFPYVRFDISGAPPLGEGYGGASSLMRKGHRASFTGRAEFVKYESGWKLANVGLTSAHDEAP